MKKAILSLCILLSTIAIFGQPSYSSRITFYGANLSVSPSENIWVATQSGYLLHTESINKLWNFCSFGNKLNYPDEGKGTFQRITSFNNDTLMISEKDFVWWTGNKGDSWEKIQFGHSSWVDAFYYLPNGKAWMSGSSQFIYYTENFGKTWKQFDKIEKDGNLRFHTICFDEDEKTGLFGSTWNVIYKTMDNCQTWQKIPTPYSQGKYKWKYNEYSETRPEINKIKIAGNNYITSQHQRIFVTRKDSIDWIQLPFVRDFEVTVNGNIYLLYKDHTVELLDCNLTPLWKSKESLPENIISLAVQNETLFFLTPHSVGKINEKTYLDKEAFTDELPIEEPYLQVTFRGNKYGFSNKDILLYEKDKCKWKRLFSGSFIIGDATVYKGNVIVTNNDLTKHYILNLEEKRLHPFSVPDKLFPTDVPIKEFSIELGSRGCFHHETSRRTYVRKGDVFKSDPLKDTTDNKNEMPISINATVVETLIHAIDSLKHDRLSFSDLEISGDDILNYQKMIDEESQSTEDRPPHFLFDEFEVYTFDENSDFNFYRNIVPLLDRVTDDVIEYIFNPKPNFWSTTVYWRKISIWLGNSTSLEITNSDYKPNFYYSPWTIKYNGLTFKINSFKIGKIINELSNGCFLRKRYRDKNYLLFQIADYFYQRDNLQ
ncbi:hypothetical protein [Bacteroides sp. 519]|uniref:WD40/YVTN/BNR-like repeat-containing protein n=1 Tax=Bacteroides sp. 519 TaxID=2302937 RepID=UPI0013D0E14B|nr:hypothetical protein [Bacteroides sp. 519]NDV58121.1 hypothetical protein [Bacteroides sp. 519]